MPIYLIQLGACYVNGLDHVVVSCVAHSLRVGGENLGAVEALNRTLLFLANHFWVSRGKVEVQRSLFSKTLLACPTCVGATCVHLPIMPPRTFQREKPLLLSHHPVALTALEPLLSILVCRCKMLAHCFRWQDGCFTLGTLS